MSLYSGAATEVVHSCAFDTNCGTAFLLNRENQFKILFNFSRQTVTGYPYNYNGYPSGPLVQGRDGHFYGTTTSGFEEAALSSN